MWRFGDLVIQGREVNDFCDLRKERSIVPSYEGALTSPELIAPPYRQSGDDMYRVRVGVVGADTHGQQHEMLCAYNHIAPEPGIWVCRMRRHGDH